MPRQRKWFAARIAFELHSQEAAIRRQPCCGTWALWDSTDAGLSISTGTSTGSRSASSPPAPITWSLWTVKEVGRIPDCGGWGVHGKGSAQAKAVDVATAAGAKAGYVCLHTAADGFSRLAFIETLSDEKAVSAIGFMHRARGWFAGRRITHIQRIVTDNVPASAPKTSR
jgi:hypothetical protein